MSKSSIKRKDIQRFIRDSRSNGKSDQEIYNELSLKYYDKKTIALLITGTVTQEYREKFKAPNSILLILIGITIIFKILFVFGMTIDMGKVWPLLFVFIVPLINIFFFYEVLRYNAIIYKVIGLLTIASLFKTIGDSLDSKMIYILINLFLAGGIIGLSFFLSSKLLPNYNPKKLVKDPNGEYILK